MTDSSYSSKKKHSNENSYISESINEHSDIKSNNDLIENNRTSFNSKIKNKMNVSQNSSSLDDDIDEEDNNFEEDSIKKLNKDSKMLAQFKRKIIHKFDNRTLYKKVTHLKSFSSKLNILDFFISLINFVEVCFFYNEHFTYIDNGLKLNHTENFLRIIFIGVSIFTIFLIIWRYSIKIKTLKLLVELEVKPETALGPKEISSLRRVEIIEIIIHSLQPYPYLSWSFEMEIVGNLVIYSLNMFLYFLSTIRLYYILKVIKNINLFSTVRSKKILKFYDRHSRPITFLIKSNLEFRGFTTLVFIGACCLVYFSLLLKVLEYFKKDKNNPFNYIPNSIWYLLITMGTIGYGDITPKTVIGRIIGVIVCIIGVVVLSLIVVTLTIFTYLDSDELVAYNNINNLHSTQKLKKKIDKYIKRIMSNRIKKKFKRIDLKAIKDKYYIDLDKTTCNIGMHRQKEQKNIQGEFIQTLRETADKHLPPIIQGLQTIWEFEDNLEDYLNTNDNLNEICRESKNIMLSCLNLGKCLALVGGIKNLKNINEIQHKKAVSNMELHKAKKNYMLGIDVSEEQISKHTGSSTNNNLKKRKSNDILFENNRVNKDSEINNEILIKDENYSSSDL